MNLSKWLVLGLATMGLWACNSSGGNDEDSGEQDSIPADDPADPADPEKPSLHIHLADNADEGAADALFASWKATYYRTVEDEKALGEDTDIPAYGSDVNGSARIIWDKSSCVYQGQCTVSEGIGYGMVIALMQRDEEMFRKLWQYAKAFRTTSEIHLMDWKISTFFGALDYGSATDADLDIATALILGSRVWGDEEMLSYAKRVASAIWEYEIDPASKLILPGNTPMWLDAVSVNPSYFSPVALRLFAEIDGDHDWNAVLDRNYEYMENLSANGQLFPDWTDASGTPKAPPNGAGAATYKKYYLEAVRVPWRLAWDYAWYGDERAKTMLNRMADFVLDQTGGDPSNIKKQYPYQGTVSAALAEGEMGQKSSLCAVGLANPDLAQWMHDCTKVVNNTPIEGFNYFHHILQVMYAQLLNGKYQRID